MPSSLPGMRGVLAPSGLGTPRHRSSQRISGSMSLYRASLRLAPFLPLGVAVANCVRFRRCEPRFHLCIAAQGDLVLRCGVHRGVDRTRVRMGIHSASTGLAPCFNPKPARSHEAGSNRRVLRQSVLTGQEARAASERRFSTSGQVPRRGVTWGRLFLSLRKERQTLIRCQLCVACRINERTRALGLQLRFSTPVEASHPHVKDRCVVRSLYAKATKNQRAAS